MSAHPNGSTRRPNLTPRFLYRWHGIACRYSFDFNGKHGRVTRGIARAALLGVRFALDTCSRCELAVYEWRLG